MGFAVTSTRPLEEAGWDRDLEISNDRDRKTVTVTRPFSLIRAVRS